MKRFYTLAALLLVMALALTGCGMNNKESKYKNYVESLITANYVGVSKDYIRATGAEDEEAEALYLQNASRLANNLSAYYDLDISSDHELAPQMVDLAKTIYSKCKFQVGDAYVENNIYYVDVTIHPIDILNQTNDTVRQYVDDFNTRVANGEYNDYERERYENEFARGIMDILRNASENMSYKEPVTIKLRILTNDNSFYISDDDFRQIDAAILNTTEVSMPDEAPAEGDTTEGGDMVEGDTTDGEPVPGDNPEGE